MPASFSAGGHRRQRLPGAGVLLVLLAVVSLLLASAVATTVVLTSSPAPVPAGVDGIGTAPPAGTSASPTASPEPSPTATASSPATTAPSTPSPTPETTAPPTTDPVTAMEDEVVALTNAERKAAGCGALHIDDRLHAAARAHSEDMARYDYFDHTGRDGSSPSDRAARAGYPGGVGENIAVGYRTPQDVMQGWMGSDGHRANLLNCDYVAIGVGLAYDSGGRPYWTQDFGHR